MVRLWTNISRGVAIVAVLTSATSIINTVVRGFSIPLSTWMVSWIEGYRALFYPLIEATLGRIFLAVHFQIPTVGMDIIVFYCAIAASWIRTENKFFSEKNVFRQILLFFQWPLRAYRLGKLVFSKNFKREYLSTEREIPYEEFIWAAKNTIRNFVYECGKILLIVSAAILANATGVLK